MQQESLFEDERSLKTPQPDEDAGNVAEAPRVYDAATEGVLHQLAAGAVAGEVAIITQDGMPVALVSPLNLPDAVRRYLNE